MHQQFVLLNSNHYLVTPKKNKRQEKQIFNKKNVLKITISGFLVLRLGLGLAEESGLGMFMYPTSSSMYVCLV